MSDYSDYRDDDSVSDDESVPVSTEAIMAQLLDAIRAGGGDLEDHLREILAPVVTDDDIQKALCWAARDGSVIACRLLWAKLSRRGKRKYSKTASIDWFGSLHVAASNGHLEVLRLFIQEFKWNINQKNGVDKTPLCYAIRHLEMARFLLENGANVNQGGRLGPLWYAVRENNIEVSRLLLMEYQANPNLNLSQRPVDEEDLSHNTDNAIIHANAEMLRLLLQYGAFIGHIIDTVYNGTSLNVLLSRSIADVAREAKLDICRILIEHAKDDHATAAFMQASFEFAIQQQTTDDIEVERAGSCPQILLDAGIDPRMSMYCAIRAENLSVCQLLVREYQVDPFLEEEEESNENDNGDDGNDDDEPATAATAAASPFLAAARLADTSLLEYFLGVWDEQFSSTGGKNSDGDYPIHVVCCDPHVSLLAIQVLVDRQADSLTVVDGEQGLLPFHFAANWGASLDVIFYLLQQCPNALCHGGNAVAVSAANDLGPRPSSFAAVGTSGSTNGIVESNSDESEQQNARGPVKKKAKTKHSN